jgi:hypothetical protein
MDGHLLDLGRSESSRRAQTFGELGTGSQRRSGAWFTDRILSLESYGSRTMNPIGMVTNAISAEMARGTIMTLPPNPSQ